MGGVMASNVIKYDNWNDSMFPSLIPAASDSVKWEMRKGIHRGARSVGQDC